MCVFNFDIFFKINYKCSPGESVFVVGNIKELGNWDPTRAVPLSWNEGHNWEKTVKLTQDNTKNIEYKFIVAPTHKPCHCCVVRWESGSNRILNLKSVSNLHV